MEIIEIISAWSLGVLTLYITNDSSDITKCRMEILDLEKALEELRNAPSTRSLSSDVEQIKIIKNILKRLNVYHAGLAIKSNKLQHMIDQSLYVIREMEKDRSEPNNYPSFIGVNLGMIWGDNDNRCYEASNLKIIQKFLHAGFIGRIWLRVIEQVNMIPCTQCSCFHREKS